MALKIKKFRFDGEAWFSAHNGAAEAGRVFVPEQSYDAWLERARDVVYGPNSISSRMPRGTKDAA